MVSSIATNLCVLLGLGLAGIYLMTRKIKKVVKEDFGAFIQRLKLLPPPPPLPPIAPHPLTGLSFAVSDIFDIEGFVTGFGNLEWEETHDAAMRTSSSVVALVDGGSKCTGKTIMNDMAYGLSGENKYLGTPTNPTSPSHVPGGSSSGSAVAVAASIVDFSLGVDTIGGVRVPAAFCGVFGFRPSHGAVTQSGIIPVATSLDTVGWFGKDPDVLYRVGKVLLQFSVSAEREPLHIIIADDCFQSWKHSGDRVRTVVTKSALKMLGKQSVKHENLNPYFLSKVPSLKALPGKGDGAKTPLQIMADTAEFLYRYEFRKNHREWIDEAKCLSAEVREAINVSENDVDIRGSIKKEVRDAVHSLLKDDRVLAIPTVADSPPKLGEKEIFWKQYERRANQLLSIASLSGCCQAVIPLGSMNKCPLSVSFLARNGCDRLLLNTVKMMYACMVEQAEAVSELHLSTNVEKSAEITKEEGNAAFRSKQWQKAIELYSRAIKINKDNPTYYINRAAAFLEVSSFIQAEADCSAAIALDKKNVKAYFRRGTAREMLGYYKEAVEDFHCASVLEPTNKSASQAVDKLSRLF